MKRSESLAIITERWRDRSAAGTTKAMSANADNPAADTDSTGSVDKIIFAVPQRFRIFAIVFSDNDIGNLLKYNIL